MPKPGTLELRDTKWSLEVDASAEPAKPIYGHQKLPVGRMSIEMPDLMEQARGVLRSRSGDLIGAIA